MIGGGIGVVRRPAVPRFSSRRRMLAAIRKTCPPRAGVARPCAAVRRQAVLQSGLKDASLDARAPGCPAYPRSGLLEARRSSLSAGASNGVHLGRKTSRALSKDLCFNVFPWASATSWVASLEPLCWTPWAGPCGAPRRGSVRHSRRVSLPGWNSGAATTTELRWRTTPSRRARSATPTATWTSPCVAIPLYCPMQSRPTCAAIAMAMARRHPALLQ